MNDRPARDAIDDSDTAYSSMPRLVSLPIGRDGSYKWILCRDLAQFGD